MPGGIRRPESYQLLHDCHQRRGCMRESSVGDMIGPFGEILENDVIRQLTQEFCLNFDDFRVPEDKTLVIDWDPSYWCN